jgi:hypothetical protein
MALKQSYGVLVSGDYDGWRRRYQWFMFYNYWFFLTTGISFKKEEKALLLFRSYLLVPGKEL